MGLRQYLLLMDRVGTQIKIKKSSNRKHFKKIAIVDYHFFDEFLTELRDAPDVLLRRKAIIALSLSGGLRITEALEMQRSDIDLSTNMFKITVLKKHRDSRPIIRDCKLMPIAAEIVKAYLEKYPSKNYEYIFAIKDPKGEKSEKTKKVSRQSAYNWVRKLLGPGACNHSFRHSHISYLLHEKKLPHALVEAIMKVEPHVIHIYNQINAVRELGKLW